MKLTDKALRELMRDCREDTLLTDLAAEVLRLRKDLRSACKTLQVAGHDKGYAIADRMRAKGKVE